MRPDETRCSAAVLGSAHVSCAGDGVYRREFFLRSSSQGEFVALEPRDQHARRVRYRDFTRPIAAGSKDPRGG